MADGWTQEEIDKAALKKHASILDEAKAATSGDRQRDYGTPDDNFGLIASLINAYLGDKLAKPLTATDVALMMILTKIARQRNRNKRDNLVDIAGYAACASELKENME